MATMCAKKGALSAYSDLILNADQLIRSVMLSAEIQPAQTHLLFFLCLQSLLLLKARHLLILTNFTPLPHHIEFPLRLPLNNRGHALFVWALLRGGEKAGE